MTPNGTVTAGGQGTHASAITALNANFSAAADYTLKGFFGTKTALLLTKTFIIFFFYYYFTIPDFLKLNILLYQADTAKNTK